MISASKEAGPATAVLVAGLTLIAIGLCGRVEYLNSKSFTPLHRTYARDGGQPLKWRTLMPSRYRRMGELEIAEQAEQYDDRDGREQFVREQRFQLEATIRQARVELQLKYAVQAGWLTYLVVPVVVSLAVRGAGRTRPPRVRLALGCCLAADIAVGGLVIHREYFTAIMRG